MIKGHMNKRLAMGQAPSTTAGFTVGRRDGSIPNAAASG